MDGTILIRGGVVVDGTASPAQAADVRVRNGRIVEVGPGCGLRVSDEFDASGAVVTPGFIDTHAHTDPQVFWDPLLDPDPLHGVTTMLVGNCSLSSTPSATPPAPTSPTSSPISKMCRATSSTTASRGRGSTTPAIATRSTRPAPAPIWPRWSGTARFDWRSWVRTPGPGRPPPKKSGRDGSSARAPPCGRRLGTLHVPARRRHRRAAPCRRAPPTTDEFDALLDVIQPIRARAWSRSCPALLGSTDPRWSWKTSPAGAAHADSRSPGPVSPTPTATRRPLRSGSSSPVAFNPKCIRFYPAALASHRRLPAQLGLLDDVHVHAGGLAPASSPPQAGCQEGRCLTDPHWRADARHEWDRVEKALFPHRRPERVRFVEVHGAENEKWLGTHARRPGGRAGRAPLRCVRRLRAGQRLPARGGRPGRRQRRRRYGREGSGRSGRAHQLVGCRSPHADALRVRRHHPSPDTPRSRPRRPGPRRRHPPAVGSPG